MSKKQSAAETTLIDALADLERPLETPFISGELATWIGDVQNAATQTGVSLRAALSGPHRAQIAQIEREDEEMHSTSQELREEDQELLGLFEAFSQAVSELHTIADSAEENEAELAPRAEALQQQGLEFVIRARTQEVAIETWLVEAFNRDRGVAD